MRRRRRKILWPILLLILAVGMFTRGRTNSAQRPASPIQAALVSEKPAAGPPELPAQPSTPVALHEPVKTRVSGSRNERQLRLRIVGVHDGDTITGFDESKTQYKIRLDAIDAPELGQPFGQASKKALSEKVFGKDVVVIAKTKDKYGRTVGHVLVDGRDVNLLMLEGGMAWHYKHYDHNARLARAEEEARAAKKGLWSDESSVPPWEWRKTKRDSRKQMVPR
jgi:endonuclease YncB( thermonuclease family)